MQILSLNLTNLLILVLLKTLILAAGLIGAGNWGQYGRARSYERKFWMCLFFPLHFITGKNHPAPVAHNHSIYINERKTRKDCSVQWKYFSNFKLHFHMLHVPLIHFIQFKSVKITRQKKGWRRTTKKKFELSPCLLECTCFCEYVAEWIVAETMSWITYFNSHTKHCSFCKHTLIVMTSITQSDEHSSCTMDLCVWRQCFVIAGNDCL